MRSSFGGIVTKSFRKPDTPMMRVNMSHTSNMIIVAALLFLTSSKGRLSLRPQACTAMMMRKAIPKTNAINSAEICNGIYGMNYTLLTSNNIEFC